MFTPGVFVAQRVDRGGGGYRERNVIQHIFRGTRLYDSDPVDMTQLALSFVLTCFIFLVHFWKIMEDLNGKFD